MDIREYVPLAPLTTFKIGGPARWYVEVAHEDELREAVEYAKMRRIPFMVFSGGSNVLIPDEGVHALVIRLVEGEHVFFERGLQADAGCNLFALIETAAERGFGGWEKLAGIPGTIGGAVRGNAGAFGVEIKDFVTRVVTLDTETMRSHVSVYPTMTFSYRNSSFKQDPKQVILGVTVELAFVRKDEAKRRIEETVAERERRHLQNVQAAGSFFLNPVAPANIVALFEGEKKLKAREGRVPAGWLIERAGLKGARVGGAVASDQHPNYLVNTGSATAKDVLELAAKIQAEVRRQFGIELSEEAALFHS